MLELMYLRKGMSMQKIAETLGCSLHKVKYWMDKHCIKTRSISEAVYVWHNPQGDPFKYKKPQSVEEAMLYGMGLGLYWGEGTKANQGSVRLGNTDPKLIRTFIDFLVTIFNIKQQDLRFSLQIFTDIDEKEALDYWQKTLKVKPEQFTKTVVTISGSVGNYRKKSRYGVLTVHYHNTKLRNLIVSMLPA